MLGGGERHWTERVASPAIFGAVNASGAAGVAGAAAAGSGGGTAGEGGGRPRVTAAHEHQQRVRLVNRVLDPLGLVLSGWSASSYVLSTKTGRSALVPHLGELWPAAERLLGRPCDPLDPDLLSRLSR